MEQLNYFDLFDMNGDDIVAAMEDKKKEKGGEKKEGKQKQQKQQKVKGEIFSLPITVYGVGFSLVISAEEGKESMGMNALKKEVEKAYPALGSLAFTLKSMGNGAMVFAHEVISSNAEIDLKEEAQIWYGDLSMTIAPGTCTNLDEVLERWLQAYPEFEGCELMLSRDKKLIVPYFKENTAAGKKFSIPLKVGFLKLEVEIEEGESVDLKTAAQALEKAYPVYKGCRYHYQENENRLIPILEFNSGGNPKVDIVALPITVRTALTELRFEQGDFGEKTEATLEEIRMKLEEIYPEYSKERTEMVYDARHFVIPILKGSSKGMQFLSPLKSGYALYFVTGRDEKQYRIEKTPVGKFVVCTSQEAEELEFHFSLPKIPEKLLIEVLEFFRRNREHEAACQIFYKQQKGYYIYYPDQEYSVAAVTFARDNEREFEDVLVMDLHSHGEMAAFFSSQDNFDEKGTRLFLVAGNMTGRIQIRVRAGMIGRFVELPLKYIFELGREASV